MYSTANHCIVLKKLLFNHFYSKIWGGGHLPILQDSVCDSSKDYNLWVYDCNLTNIYNVHVHLLWDLVKYMYRLQYEN